MRRRSAHNGKAPQTATLPFSGKITLLLLGWLLGCVVASAQSRRTVPPPKLSQYMHTAWKIRDGDIPVAPNALAQTTDGYLWLGSDAGLFRFDGIRFQQPLSTLKKKRDSFEVYALHGSIDGSLWIGTGRNIYRLKDGSLSIVGGFTAHINQIISDPKEDVWFVRTRQPRGDGGLCEVLGNGFRCFGEREGLDCDRGNAVAPDGAGGFWVGWDHLCHWDGRSSAVLPFRMHEKDGGTLVTAFAAHSDGSVTVGIFGVHPDQFGTETIAMKGGIARVIQRSDAIGKGENFTSLLTAHDGSLWAGTEQHGIYHVTAQGAEHLGSADGLSGDYVNALYQDREGNIWVGTTEGLDRLRVPKILTFTTKEGLNANLVNSILASSDGNVWIGSVDGLNVLKNGRLQSFPLQEPQVGSQVLSLFEDRDRKLWIATSAQLLVYSNNKLTIVYAGDGTNNSLPSEITQDRYGVVWAASKVLLRIDRGIVQSIAFSGKPPIIQVESDPTDGVWLRFANESRIYRYRAGTLESPIRPPTNEFYNYFFVGKDGSLWAPSSFGLMHWSGGQWSHLDESNGLPCGSVRAAQEDRSGNWWIMSGCGVLKVAKAEMDHWERDPTFRVHPQLFGVGDGARNTATDYQPRCTVSIDGRIWFGGYSGIQVIDPANLPTNELVPPVHIERLLADGIDYQDGQRLRPSMKNIEIDYAGLSLVNSQQVQFRYRMWDFDSTWQEAHSRRQAFYQNLPPGIYRFQVLASNNDGVWNDKGDTITFVVPPAFYQTVWFRSCAVIAVLLCVWILIRIREIRATEAFEARMAERLGERDRIARELHDTLLQGFQSIVLRFQVAVNAIQPPQQATAMLQDAIERADVVLKEGRARVKGLRRAKISLRLADAINAFIRDQDMPSGPTCRLEESGTERQLQEFVYEEVYAIARESLLNALHHANAMSIVCDLRYDKNNLIFECRDNGVGLPTDVLAAGHREDHYGLVGIKERAGRIAATLKIESANREGTTIRVIVPGRIAYLKPEGFASLRAGFIRLFSHSTELKDS